MDFPAPIPEMPVSEMDVALEYYRTRLGFTIDWRDDADAIAGISRGNCRMFLTSAAFRQHYGNSGPVLVWVNLDSKDEVDALHGEWSANGATIISVPMSKPYGLHEFLAADADGNLMRVFYDFATPEREQAGGR
jgi:uncharacterized glyoxalase superfamily protein PhnB